MAPGGDGDLPAATLDPFAPVSPVIQPDCPGSSLAEQDTYRHLLQKLCYGCMSCNSIRRGEPLIGGVVMQLRSLLLLRAQLLRPCPHVSQPILQCICVVVAMGRSIVGGPPSRCLSECGVDHWRSQERRGLPQVHLLLVVYDVGEGPATEAQVPVVGEVPHPVPDVPIHHQHGPGAVHLVSQT